MAGIGEHGRELPPGIAYLRGLIRGNVRFLVGAAVLAGLAAAGDEVWKAPRFEQRGLIHISPGVRLVVGEAIASEIAFLAKDLGARAVGEKSLFDRALRNWPVAARVQTYEGNTVAEIEIRARSEAEAAQKITSLLEGLHERYGAKTVLVRQQADDRRRQILDEITSIDGNLRSTREEIDFLKPHAPYSPALADSVAELARNVSAKQEQRADRRIELDILEAKYRTEKLFEFIPSSASTLSPSPVRLVKRLLTASLFAAALVMCFLLVRDVWRGRTS
jgi:hypothetical protein